MHITNVLIIDKHEYNNISNRFMWDFELVLVKDEKTGESWVAKDSYGLLSNDCYNFKGKFNMGR